MIQKRHVVLLTAAMHSWSPAGATDLANCVYSNGVKIPADECAAFNAAEDRKKAFAAKAEASRVENARVESQREADRAAEQARLKSEYAARKQADELALAKRQQEFEREQAVQTANDRRAEARRTQVKQMCGADYMTPSIGMSIGRAKECLGRMKLTGQINRKDGVVSTYVGATGYLHVMDGRVVAWGR